MRTALPPSSGVGAYCAPRRRDQMEWICRFAGNRLAVKPAGLQATGSVSLGRFRDAPCDSRVDEFAQLGYLVEKAVEIVAVDM